MIPEVEEKPPKEKSASKPGLIKLLRGWVRAALFDNAAIKFVSLVLAVTLFILVNTGQDVTIWVDVGLEYTTPDDRVMVSDPVDEVTIGLRGSWRRTRRFNRRELDERITIDLRDRQDGLFEFQPHMFRIPQGLELVSITPRTMRLEFEPRASKSVPIRVETVGNPVAGYRVANATARPRSVTVRGAKSAVDAVDAVETLGVSLDGRSESFVDTYPLKLPAKVEVEGKTNVEVKIELVEELERRVLQGVPVVVRSTEPSVAVDKKFEVDPSQVDVVLLGSQQDIESAIAGPLFPYVTVAPGFTGGRVPVLLGVGGVAHEIKPAEVTVTRIRAALPD